MKPTIQLVDNQSRSTLCEGRNYGMGVAFCKKTGEETYETVMPITACKDFLHEVVYGEATGNPISCYGLSYKKTGCFDGQEYGYLAIKILSQGRGATKYAGMDKDIELLNTNIKKIELLMRYVDKQFKIPVSKRTRIKPTLVPDTYLVFMPIEYTKYTYTTSLYTLILRMGLTFDQKKSPAEFLDTYNLSPDNSLWMGAKPKYKLLVEKGWVVQNLNEIKSPNTSNVHNVGILGFNLKYVE